MPVSFHQTTVHTYTSYSDSQGYLSLEVRDKGKPIPEDEHDLIFKAFYRSPSTRHIKGTGIGLPLVQQILKMHKADLSLESGGVIGNTFTIRFLTDFTESMNSDSVIVLIVVIFNSILIIINNC
jgi:signal transduction histidine kinase